MACNLINQKLKFSNFEKQDDYQLTIYFYGQKSFATYIILCSKEALTRAINLGFELPHKDFSFISTFLLGLFMGSVLERKLEVLIQIQRTH